MAMHKSLPSRRACVAIAATGLLACGTGVVRADSGEWQQAVLLYGMGAAIDGDAQIGDLKVPVDVSMSELFDALEFGAMAAYRADNGTWSYTVDATFMGLGGTSKSERGLVKGDMDLDQFTLMGTVGRHWTEHLDALFSLSYFDLSTDLKLTTTAPASGAVTVRTASVDASWVDPMIGLHYGLPFRDDWRLNLRGDVGGFGIGSNFSYQLLATVQWRSGGRFGAVAGYRVIGFDYEDGHKGSRNYQRFDLTEQGPMLGVTYDF